VGQHWEKAKREKCPKGTGGTQDQFTGSRRKPSSENGNNDRRGGEEAQPRKKVNGMSKNWVLVQYLWEAEKNREDIRSQVFACTGGQGDRKKGHKEAQQKEMNFSHNVKWVPPPLKIT